MQPSVGRRHCAARDTSPLKPGLRSGEAQHILQRRARGGRCKVGSLTHSVTFWLRSRNRPRWLGPSGLSLEARVCAGVSLSLLC